MKHRRTARRAVLAGLAVVSLAAAANARPTVLWHSSKAVPDQTVMLFGDRLGEDTRVVAWHAPDEAPDTPVETPRLPGNGTRLEVRGRSRSDCLMVGLPDDFGPGVYALQVTSAGGASGLVYLNRPQATWWLGDQPEGVSPGASIRLFGQHLLLTLVGETPRRSDALPDGHMGKAVLTDAKGTVHNLTLENVDKYTLTARLPASAAVGSATVHVHNGHGGRWGWSEALPVEVRVAEPWPTTRYNVRELGAAGDGQADDTESLRAALRRAERNGGGIVTIPRGTYKITGSLTVPARTVVRGEGRDTTRLYVPKETPEFNAVFAGDADFAIEHLWLTAQTPRRLIAAPDQEPLYRMPIGHPPAEFWTRRHVNPRGPARNVRLFDLRLHHLRYAHRVGSADKDPRRPESSGPSTVITYGPYVDIQKCEIVSSGMPVRAMDAYRSRIMDNVLHTGRNGWYSLSRCRETCFEGNRIVGHDLEASYGGYNGKQIAQVYIADNTFGGGFGGERESLTFDAPGAYLWQSVEIVKTATAGEVVVRPSEGKTWERYSLAGLGCLVIKGTGLGQMRQIVSHTADTLVLDRPWDVVPEPGSAVALWPYRTQVVVYRNRSEDTSVGVQLWAGGHDFVVDSNTSVRTSGMYGTATHFVFQGMQQFLHCFFTQWLNNTIDQGYIYQQGPFDYATLGLINRLSDRGPAPEATPILANVIRGNAVSDGARIGLFHYGANYTRPIVGAALSGLSPFAEPPGRATLIEGNTVTHASVGIEVQAFFEDTLVRDNACSEVEGPGQGRAAGPGGREGHTGRPAAGAAGTRRADPLVPLRGTQTGRCSEERDRRRLPRSRGGTRESGGGLLRQGHASGRAQLSPGRSYRRCRGSCPAELASLHADLLGQAGRC